MSILSNICDLQVVNHGVPDEVIAGIKRDIHKFFELPLAVKNAYAQRPGDLQGYGQAFIFSDDQKLDWADLFALFTQPPEGRDMSYWPSQPDTFR
jgi:isopenicillin N synthase-like dioxygenase